MRGAWAGRSWRAGAAVAALLGAVAAAPPPGWTAAPAEQRPYVYLEGEAGSVLRDTLSLTNPGTAPVTVRLSGEGAASVSFAARSVTVPARTRADVPFAVTVTPRTAPGDHRGAVLAADAAGRQARVPVHLRVSGPRLAAFTVEDVRLDDAGTLHYTLVNRGSTVLEPHLSVRAHGILGTVLDRPSRALPVSLRPGERLARSEPWPDPPALDSVTVDLRATASGAPPVTARAEAVLVPPAAVVAGALFAGAAAVAATTAWARRAGRRRAPPAGREPEGRSVERQLAEATAGERR
ncbi:COG1470 family protein [Streptomyces sp. NPDC054861]